VAATDVNGLRSGKVRNWHQKSVAGGSIRLIDPDTFDPI
jgi:hypothetical protein